MSEDPHDLTLTVVHEIPGRLRSRLSHRLLDMGSFESTLRSHAGIEPVGYSPVTRSLLLRYDPSVIRREELLVRAALAFSLQYGRSTVRIQAAPSRNGLTPSVAVSGALLLAAGFSRALGVGPGPLKVLDGLAGLATGSAVVSHAVQELRTHGAYHPEVVSVAYLAVGMIRGNAWRAGVLTWFASFGRHLLQSEAQAVEIRSRLDGGEPEVVAFAAPAKGWRAAVRILPDLLRALVGAAQPGSDLLSNLQEVSYVHDRVLDAMGPWKGGIPLRIPDRQSWRDQRLL